MKKLILILVIALLTINVSAQTFEVGGINYNITSANTVEVIAKEPKYEGDVVIPEQVNYNGHDYVVTVISGGSWNSGAFYNCTWLTSITIPNSVTTIGEGAFCRCSGLTSVKIPNSVTTIGDYAFFYCSGLSYVTISNSVVTIGKGAFASCIGLTSGTIGSSVAKIGGYAFSDCKSLTSVTIGNSVAKIGGYAFSGCKSLTSIYIPSSVTSIDSSAFLDCSSLTEINVSSDNPNYSSIDGVLYNNDKTILIQYPAGKISTVFAIPNSVNTIGYEAFCDCIGLTSITIPNSVNTIGEAGFWNCTGLTSIKIPNSVTKIGDYTFGVCKGLTSITCYAIVPPALGGTYVFLNVTKNIPLYVPVASVDAYKVADQWNEFDIIETLTINDGADQTICKGESATLTATGSDTYSWSNGAITQSITVSPTTITTYSVTGTNGETTTSDDIVVNINIVIADFSYVAETSNIYTFEDKSIGLINKHFWDFNDGEYANISNVEKTFTKVGNFNVCLTVYDTILGCMDIVCKTIDIGSVPCNASFSFTVDSLTNTASFTALDGFTGNTYYWEFGDGTTSNETNPQKVYQNAGYYNVKLSVYNADNSCFANTKQVVIINDPIDDCKADFIYTASENDNTVIFKDVSLAKDIKGWTWSYGDGTTATVKNPGKAFKTSGYHNVCLHIITKNNCKNFVCKDVIVNTKTPNGCKSDFSYLVKDNDVYFKEKSHGNIEQWKWSFGDATSSTTASPEKTYNQSGYYNVALTVIAKNGCTKTSMQVVNINSPEVIQAGFVYKIDSANKKANSYPVYFVGASFGDPAVISWDFGDGNTDSLSLTPVHQYADTGIYNVCLTVTSLKLNQTHTYCEDILVKMSDGISDTTFIDENTDKLSITNYELTINVYPNPFSDETNISLQLQEKSHIRIEVYDILGSKIETLLDVEKSVGNHNIIWSPASNVKGIYFIKVITNNNQIVKKVVVN